MPEQAAGASYGDSMIIAAAGVDPRNGRPFVDLEPTVGGWGAWQGSDGEGGLINNVNGSLKDLPDRGAGDEVTRCGSPSTRFRPDSGGPGQWRGGNGIIREYESLADCVVSLWFERSRTPAWGLFGGADAQRPEVVINPGRDDEVRTLKANAREAQGRRRRPPRCREAAAASERSPNAPAKTSPTTSSTVSSPRTSPRRTTATKDPSADGSHQEKKGLYEFSI